MYKIDLTLRREFLKNPSRQDRFDDTNSYLNKMGYEDQRRAKLSILGIDDFKINFLNFIINRDINLEFFKEDDNLKYSNNEITLHESIFRITGVLTNTLSLEYDTGYGREEYCDCCGGFRSSILNAKPYGICDKCEKEYRTRNEEFWERRQNLTEETWID